MILTDDSAISRARGALEASIDLSARLPAPVFRADFAEYCWLEFEEILCTPFFTALQALAAVDGDREIVITADDLFAVLPLSDDPTAYHSFLDTDFRREAADSFALAGTSGKWAFVGSRSVELTVGGSVRHGTWPMMPGLRYQTFECALRLAAAPYRGNPPPGYLSEFERNYGARSWNIAHYVEG